MTQKVQVKRSMRKKTVTNTAGLEIKKTSITADVVKPVREIKTSPEDLRLPAYRDAPVQLDDVVKFFLNFQDKDTITTYQQRLAKRKIKFTYVNTKRVFALIEDSGLISRQAGGVGVQYILSKIRDITGASVFDRYKSASMMITDLVRF